MNRLHRWFCRSAMWERTLKESLFPWALKGADLGDHILEVGPGPGLTTDLLRQMVGHVTSIEIDPRLADLLKRRLESANVKIVEGDATDMPFDDHSFSGAVSFTMLHHVPSAELQDRLLSEVRRVLEPGAWFVGTDSVWSRTFQLFHLFDTMVPVAPATFHERLERAGFADVRVSVADRAFRFRARRPASVGKEPGGALLCASGATTL